MKAKMLSILVCVMFLGVAVGCSAPSGKPEAGAGKEGKAPSSTKEYRINIAGNAPGGTSYAHSAGLAQIVQKYSDGINASVQATTGAPESARVMISGDCNMANLLGSILNDAYYGVGFFKDKPNKNFRLVMVGPGAGIHVVARADAGINSIADLRGKRVAVGPPGVPSSEVLFPAILEQYGITYSDIKPYWLTWKEITEALQDKTVDAAQYFVGVPAAGLMEVTSNMPIKFLTYAEKIPGIVKKLPYCDTIKLPAGKYKGQNTDIEMIGDAIVFATRDDVPEDVMYKMVKIAWEKMDEWSQIHASAKDFTIERTLSMANRFGAPLHPGVEKYLKEKGYLK